MNIPFSLLYAFKSSFRMKTRLALTVAAMAIAVFSFLVLSGLVSGLKDKTISILSSFGPGTIVVVPVDVSSANPIGASFIPITGKITEKDYSSLSRIPELLSIGKGIRSQAKVSFKKESKWANIVGISPQAYFSIFENIKISSGRVFGEKESGSAVIGSRIASELFSKQVGIHSFITINGERFKVVGILENVGGSGFSSPDSNIFITYSKARKMFGQKYGKDNVGVVFMKVDNEHLDSAVSEIYSILDRNHNIVKGKRDYGVVSSNFIKQQIDSIASVLTAFLLGVSSLAFIVGVISIANSIYSSVLERTREIGTLKALGMSSSEIEKVFLAESMFISLIGFSVGVVLSFIVLSIVSYLMDMDALPDLFGMFASLFAVVSSSLLAAYFPSRKAGSVSPSESLRYE